MTGRRLSALCLGTIGAFCLFGTLPAAVRADDPASIEFFEQKIRPVLVQHCYACHSEEASKKNKLKGELFLDTRAGLLKGGESGPAIVPGKSAESLLVKALLYEDGYQMPPSSKLPAEIAADFRRWIDGGAPDPRDGAAASVSKREIDLEAGRRFWSFRPLESVTPPEVQNAAWPRTAIDRFILARQEAQGVRPNGQAARETLLRRLFFDVIGLPPAPEEIDLFLNDSSPDAYSALVDRLLGSAHFGERWARHWLDTVRYAESGGYEFDGDRGGAYHYRDFVIRALNQDLPYTEFVRWQVAGDQLLPGDYHAGAATGFLVAGPYPGQITAKTVERIRYDQLDDMLATLGSSMLGLTLGCARCHDHKYDPLLQQDYYRLLASVSRVVSTDQKLDPHPEVYRAAKAAWDTAHQPLVEAVDRFEAEQFPARFALWREGALVVPEGASPRHPDPKWLLLELVEANAAKATLTRQDDGAVVASGKLEAGDTYTLVAKTHQTAITALRLEALAHAAAPAGGPGLDKEGLFRLTKLEVTARPLDPKDPAPAVPVKLKPGPVTFEQEGKLLAAVLDNDANSGWSVGGQAGKDHAATFEVEGAVGFEGGTVLTCVLKFEAGAFGMARPRLAISTAPLPATLEGEAGFQNLREIKTVLERGQGQLTAANSRTLLSWYRRFDPQASLVLKTVEDHQAVEPRPDLASVFAVGAGGGDVFFLTRGEVDRKQARAAPGVIEVLSTSPEKEARWMQPPAGQPAIDPRVGLARWLTDAEQGAGHLLARVIVNRIWAHYFARGIVATPNDFGAQGERPSHPELLDWLASELIRNQWKLKSIHKLILMSAVYQQDHTVKPEYLHVDPENRLWWHRQPRRLEGEIIRDALLAVGGTLDPRLYGPGTLDANTPRRSIYLTVKRSQLIPFLQLFDLPEPVQSVGKRSNTTVPTQALALMNAAFVRQSAERLAQRARAAGGDEPGRCIEQAYRLAFARKPQPAEMQRLLAFLEGQAQLAGGAAGAGDKGLVELCHLLLCLNEFVYVD